MSNTCADIFFATVWITAMSTRQKSICNALFLQSTTKLQSLAINQELGLLIFRFAPFPKLCIELHSISFISFLLKDKRCFFKQLLILNCSIFSVISNWHARNQAMLMNKRSSAYRTTKPCGWKGASPPPFLITLAWNDRPETRRRLGQSSAKEQCSPSKGGTVSCCVGLPVYAEPSVTSSFWRVGSVSVVWRAQQQFQRSSSGPKTLSIQPRRQQPCSSFAEPCSAKTAGH